MVAHVLYVMSCPLLCPPWVLSYGKMTEYLNYLIGCPPGNKSLGYGFPILPVITLVSLYYS